MIELLIVIAVVSWSALVVFKKVFPKTAYSFFSAVANYCSKQGWSALAKFFKPAMVMGCGGNCGGGSQPTSSPKKAEVQAVKWK